MFNMFKQAKKEIRRNLYNIPGWRTKRKIVVIESDDWGSIRMPSANAYRHLQAHGYRPETDPYLKYDSLASEEDLNLLFEALDSVKDKNGNSAIMTANAVMGNPDFTKIRDSGFSEYFYETIAKTFARYPNHNKSLAMWQQGREKRLFYPQFHGREHLNVECWLRGLRSGESALKEAFDLNMISISSVASSLRFHYMEGLDYYSIDGKWSTIQSLNEGLDLFADLMGYPSQSFIANCYIWSDEHEEALAAKGVKYLQGILTQLTPTLHEGRHDLKVSRRFLGQQNKFGQCYLVRNVFFEPSLMPSGDVVSECLHRIKLAFRWRKPAVICSHRLNFIGGIDSENRGSNLRKFKMLLNAIVRMWPEVEFMTSVQLGAEIMKERELN